MDGSQLARVALLTEESDGRSLHRWLFALGRVAGMSFLLHIQ